MRLVNIHCHMLYAVDDGAKSPNMMMHMIDSAYRSGVREICMTPHYNPAHFRCPREVIAGRFANAVKLAAEKYPDLKLYLGQEIYYYHDSVDDLLKGKCFTLNRTRNVLVEFGPYDDKAVIKVGVSRLLTSGFTPVIAHVERYSALRMNADFIRELRQQGAVIQVNAASVLGAYGFTTKHFVLSLIKRGIVDIIADDCHDAVEINRDDEPAERATVEREPEKKVRASGIKEILGTVSGKKGDGKRKSIKRSVCLREAYDFVLRKFGEEEADLLFSVNPAKVLKGEN